jgi:hypothetical protein
MDATAKLPIREYCVKASTTRRGGTYIGVDVLKYVLSRGCRYLDLEVYLVDNVPYVGFSTNRPTPRKHNLHNHDNAQRRPHDHKRLRVLLARATPPTAVHKPPSAVVEPTRTRRGCISIAGGITNTLMPKLINDKITGDTSIQTVMNKIVIVMDVVAAPGMLRTAPEKLVNIWSGERV